MTTRKISSYLEASPSTRALLQEVQRIAKLQTLFETVAPPTLAQACRVQQRRGGALTVVTENAAIAAKLTQLKPRLLSGYREYDSEITSIHFEVQVKEALTHKSLVPTGRALSADTIDEIRKLAETVQNQGLKDALNRLASHTRKGK